jgi:hypothetical protein
MPEPTPWTRVTGVPPGRSGGAGDVRDAGTGSDPLRAPTRLAEPWGGQNGRTGTSQARTGQLSGFYATPRSHDRTHGDRNPPHAAATTTETTPAATPDAPPSTATETSATTEETPVPTETVTPTVEPTPTPEPVGVAATSEVAAP